jgi:PRTRC genetic system protein E
MFKELVPVLRDRAVLLTVTLVDADQIRVNIVPKKLKDGDNDALTTPLSVTGTAEDLDAELSTTIISFVGSHLQMRNTLEKAKAEMEATPAKAEVTQNVPAAKPAEPTKPAPQKPASLFDMPTPATTPTTMPAEPEDDPGFAEVDDDEEPEEFEELDDAA